MEKIEGSVIGYIGEASVTARKLGRALDFFISMPPFIWL